MLIMGRSAAVAENARAVRYRQHIKEVYPNLHVETIHVVDHGQNSDIALVNKDTIFRFPRYQQGIARLAAEVDLLRYLRRYVTLAIPEPHYSSFEGHTPGRAFMGYPMIPGRPLSRRTLATLRDEQALAHIAAQLAPFLRQLHGTPTGDPAVRALGAGDPLARWEDMYGRIRERLFPHMRPDARAQVEHHFEAFLHEQRSRPVVPVLIHGDFGAENILHEPRTLTITGVVDFGSAGLDDPAVDLAAASTLGDGFVDRFEPIYPNLRDVLNRLPFYRGTFALQEALFGIENGDEEAFQAGIEEYR
jgi:aminoglycoside 2''-phosphotransferase